MDRRMPRYRREAWAASPGAHRHAEIVGVHASPGSAFIECHQLLALLETPERRCEGADVQCLSGDVEKVREQASDFAVEHADKLSAFWNRNVEQFFHC